MTVFRVGCPHCGGRAHLESGEVRLARTRSRTFYAFTCPDCGEPVRKPAGERIVELLTGNGVAEIGLAPR
ncbi:hypothetical protein BIV57_05765 [Mangrovactinospora gilvigrisea]|uniref:DUF8054 domain-containing protein n=1 Tax=Mangrovactinospora gilvigrisea TaxID=1428644 RepID=A0A1J7BY43_9ACTN|nr:hypothetical protein BIV57_05765 [Mangrovactinospora gilvigrisea]